MQLGMYTPLPHINAPEPESGMVDAWDEGARIAIEHIGIADQAGFDITLVAQRYLGPDLEAWTLASALSQTTRRITIMPAFHPTFWDPRMFAKMCASLDRISGGRLALNLVTGWWREEHAMYGGLVLDDEARYQRAEEFVTVLHRLWSEKGPVSFRGSQVTVEDVELLLKPIQAQPPIYGASRSERGMDMIARSCDVWFSPCGNDYTTVPANVAGVKQQIDAMQERARRFGRTLRFATTAFVIYDEDEAAAYRLAAEMADHGTTGRINQIHSHGLGAGLIGSKSRILENIARFDEIGIDLLLLKFYPARQALERFAEDIAPDVVSGPGAQASAPPTPAVA